MSTPLKDFRLPITESVHLWLESEAIAHNMTMQDVARDVFKEWAKKKAHAYKLATKRMKANGLQMELMSDDEEEGSRR